MGSSQSRQQYTKNIESERSEYLSNGNKCKQLQMQFMKLLILICGNNNKSSRRRFWYILLFFMITAYIMCIADVLTEYRWINQPSIILPDLGFDFADYATPTITKWVEYPDISVNISLIFTFLWLLIDGPKQQKIAIFRRFLTMMALLYLGRSICVIGTQLPTPFHSKDIMYQENWNGNLLYEACLVLLRVKATNNDVFYSGHTVVITMCAVVIETYCKRKWVIYIIWIFSLFSLYVIIATKFHYTIDVVIAFILSIIIWKLYHITMKIKAMRNHLPIFKWFESDKELAIYSASITPLLNGYNLNRLQYNVGNDISIDIETEEKESNQNEMTSKSISMDLP